MATDKNVVKAIFAIKNRPHCKPLPVIAAARTQAAQYADLEAAPENLLKRFWPGPLTLVLPARQHLPAGIVNTAGKIAIRVTSSPELSMLATAAGAPLVATSANLSGEPAPCEKKALSPVLLKNCSKSGLPWGMLARNAASAPASLPSTIVEPVFSDSAWKLKILRQGAIPVKNLLDADWEIL